MWVITNGLRKPSLGAPGYLTKMLQAKNREKVGDLEPIYLGNTTFDRKLFVAFEHTINRLCFGYVCLSQLEYHFSSFLSFFLVFFFFSSSLPIYF